jgi:protein TonB
VSLIVHVAVLVLFAGTADQALVGGAGRPDATGGISNEAYLQLVQASEGDALEVTLVSAAETDYVAEPEQEDARAPAQSLSPSDASAVPRQIEAEGPDDAVAPDEAAYAETLTGPPTAVESVEPAEEPLPAEPREVNEPAEVDLADEAVELTSSSPVASEEVPRSVHAATPPAEYLGPSAPPNHLAARNDPEHAATVVPMKAPDAGETARPIDASVPTISPSRGGREIAEALRTRERPQPPHRQRPTPTLPSAEPAAALADPGPPEAIAPTETRTIIHEAKRPDLTASFVPPSAPVEPLSDLAVDEMLTDMRMPRPRPAHVPEAFLLEYEREQRASEERRIAEENRRETERAARRHAEQTATRRAERTEEPREMRTGGRASAATTNSQASRTSSRGSRSPAPSPGAPRGSGARGEEGPSRQEVSSYTSRVYAHLSRHKRYPRDTQDRGTATVTFTLSASGGASGIRLARGSGSGALDQAALSMVRRASPFPPIPPRLGRSSMTFSVPVDFSRR